MNYTPAKLGFEVYMSAEKRNLPEIIMIHGFISAKEGWRNIAQTIADSTFRTVYVPDMRNYGSSTWSNETNIEIMSKDVSYFMREHDIKEAVLFGHSMGARIAMKLALVEPNKISKLIVEDTFPGPPPKARYGNIQCVFKCLNECINSIPLEVDLSTAKDILTKELEKKLSKKHAFFITSLRSKIEKKDGHFVWNGNPHIMKLTSIEEILTCTYNGIYEKPSLFIYGRKSEFDIPNHREEILKAFPEAVLSEIENVGHAMHIDRPEEVCEIVVDFLKE